MEKLKSLDEELHEKDIADIAYQMLLAISYMESQDIVHRDIKP